MYLQLVIIRRIAPIFTTNRMNPNRDFQVPKLLYCFTLVQEMASDHCAVFVQMDFVEDPDHQENLLLIQ